MHFSHRAIAFSRRHLPHFHERSATPEASADVSSPPPADVRPVRVSSCNPPVGVNTQGGAIRRQSRRGWWEVGRSDVACSCTRTVPPDDDPVDPHPNSKGSVTNTHRLVVPRDAFITGKVQRTGSGCVELAVASRAHARGLVAPTQLATSTGSDSSGSAPSSAASFAKAQCNDAGIVRASAGAAAFS